MGIHHFSILGILVVGAVVQAVPADVSSGSEPASQPLRLQLPSDRGVTIPKTVANVRERRNAAAGVFDETRNGSTDAATDDVSDLGRLSGREQSWPVVADLGDLRLSADPVCKGDALLLQEHFRKRFLWAVQMWEASAHSPSGWLKGGTYFLGDYDECLSVSGPIQPQYCLARLQVRARQPRPGNHTTAPPSSSNAAFSDAVDVLLDSTRDPLGVWLLSARWGVCAPASCSSGDVGVALAARFPSWVEVHVQPGDCRKPGDRSRLQTNDFAFLVACAVLTVLIGVASAVHFWGNITEKTGFLWRLLGSFSVHRNLVQLLAPGEKSLGGLSVSCLDGMRAFTTYLVVMLHHVFYLGMGPAHNMNEVRKWLDVVVFSPMTISEFWVDTFFLFSGFILAAKELSQPSSSTLRTIVMRYLRLTPSFAMVIWFYTSVFDKTGTGPMWNEVLSFQRDGCKELWWPNLLYISNYVQSPGKLCMIQTWYLNVDMQLFVLGAVFVIPLLRWRPALGRLVAVGLTLSSIIFAVVITLAQHWPPFQLMVSEFFKTPQNDEYFRWMYQRTEQRAVPFLIGILLADGMLWAKRSGKTWKLTVNRQLFWLCLFADFLLVVPFWGLAFLSAEPAAEWHLALYTALRRVLWSVGVAGIIAVLAVPTGALFVRYLSWRPFTVMSRLSYGVYLTHMALQIGKMASRRQPVHISVYSMVYDASADFVAAHVASVVLYFAIEAPFRQISKQLLTSKSRKPKTDKTNHAISLKGSACTLDTIDESILSENHKV